MRLFERTLCMLAVVALPVFSQTIKSSEDTNTVQVAVTLPVNQSRRLINSKWTRDQLVRNLKDLKKDKKSHMLIEPVAVDSDDLDESLMMARDKNWDYVVTTRLLEPKKLGGMGLGTGDWGSRTIESQPQLAGNTDPAQRMSVKFQIMRPGTLRPLAEGVVFVPDENDNDTSAANEAMRQVALRVASELRKKRSMMPE